MQKGGGELCDGIEEDVGFCGAKAFFGGEGAEDGDGGADADAASHLQVFWRVAYVNGLGGRQAHVAQRQAKRCGMGFAETGIAAANACGEVIPEIEFAQLAVNAAAISAGDQAESVAAVQLSKDAARAGQEFGAMFGVLFPPDLGGSGPLGARQVLGLIDVIPVWRILLLEFGYTPGDLHFSEHGEVGGGVGGVGVEEGAVPVEEDAFDWMAG